MSQLTTLLFDVDGTLAETEEVHRKSFNKSFAQAGLDWDWTPEIYEELLNVTGGKERIRHYLEHYLGSFEAPMNLDDYIAALHAAKTDIYTRTVGSGEVTLRPGVQRLLQEARDAGLRLGIATTTTPANVTALLEHSMEPPALDWFEVIAAGSVVPAKKPAPDIYEYAMQAMGVEPGECLAFEDSINGLRSAQAAGLRTLVTVGRYTQRQKFDGALLVLDQLGEPDQPFTVSSGDAGDHRYVSVELLNEL